MKISDAFADVNYVWPSLCQRALMHAVLDKVKEIWVVVGSSLDVTKGVCSLQMSMVRMLPRSNVQFSSCSVVRLVQAFVWLISKTNATETL